MDSQKHYWDTFTNLKRDSLYLGRYQGGVESKDRYINIFFAITSSTSIAGWAVWQQYAFVWGVIIAGSQVLNAIKSLLPYQARLKALSDLSPEVDALALTAETDWYKVCSGILTAGEIYELSMNLKRKTQQATQRHFKGISLPEDRKMLAMADGDATAYMKSFTQE